MTRTMSQLAALIVIVTIILGESMIVSAQTSEDAISVANIHDGWELTKSRKHVQGYTRMGKRTRIKEFKIQTVIDAPMEDVGKYLQQPGNWASWMRVGTDTFALLPPTPDSIYACYASIKFPLGMKTRDLVLQSTFGRFSNWGIVATHQSLPDRIPVVQNHVQMQFNAVLTARIVAPDKTEVNYEGTMRLQGNALRLYTNYIMVKRPLKMVFALKTAVERNK